MRSFEQILKAKERGDIDSVEKEVEGLPPGYIVGFALEINSDENSIRLGPGVANVRNRLVKLTDITLLTQDTAAGGDFLFDTRYYIYVGIDGRITVDRLAPVFDGQLFGRYHPIGGMRFIGRFYVSSIGKLEEIISENPLNASSISADRIVAGSLNEIVSGVLEGLVDPQQIILEAANQAQEYTDAQTSAITQALEELDVDLDQETIDEIVNAAVSSANAYTDGVESALAQAIQNIEPTLSQEDIDAIVDAATEAAEGYTDFAKTQVQIQLAQQLMTQLQVIYDEFDIITNTLFSNDIVVGKQIRSINYSEDGSQLINAASPGFWLGSNGELKANNAQIAGTFRSGSQAVTDAKVAVQDESGLISLLSFSGAGLNDMTLLEQSGAAGTYEVEITRAGFGDTDFMGKNGPAGGKIFYDKGNDTGGWRYLEAWTADEPNPPDPPGTTTFWPPNFDGQTWPFKSDDEAFQGTFSDELGAGYENTYNNLTGSNFPAGNRAATRSYGGYSDWYLPSYKELEQMRIRRNMIGGFANNPPSGWTYTSNYVSSTPIISKTVGNATEQGPVQGTETGTMIRAESLDFHLWQPNDASFTSLRRIRVIRRTLMAPTLVPTQIRWRRVGQSWSGNIDVPVGLEILLTSGVRVRFSSRQGHTLGNKWTFTLGGMRSFSAVNSAGSEYFSVTAAELFSQTDLRVTGTTRVNALEVGGNITQSGNRSITMQDVHASRRVRANAPGSSWLTGKTGSEGYNLNQKISASSYHPILRVQTHNDHYVTYGALGDAVHFNVYDRTRTTNGVDLHAIAINAATRRVGIGTTTPNRLLQINGAAGASQMFGAVGNDYADRIEIDRPIKFLFGRVYVRNSMGRTELSSRHGQLGIIGITTNTQSFTAHSYERDDSDEFADARLPISVSGFVLACTDRVYRSGTPLTCGVNGRLEKARWWVRLLFPERIIATFYKDMPEEGIWNNVEINNRKLVKVR